MRSKTKFKTKKGPHKMFDFFSKIFGFFSINSEPGKTPESQKNYKDVWDQIIKDSLRDIDLLLKDKDLILHKLLEQSPMSKLLSDIFDDQLAFPDTQVFILSVGASCRWLDNNDIDSLVKIGTNLRCNFIKELKKEYLFQEKYIKANKQFPEVMDSFDAKQFKSSITDNFDLLNEYFLRFNDDTAETEITIWMPDDHQTTGGRQETLKIKANPNRMPVGFYLVGVDYSTTEGRLRFAYRTGKYEAGQFCDGYPEFEKGLPIWSI